MQRALRHGSFIELAARRVYLAGITANPTGESTTQQARNIVETFVERATPIRFLIHDRDSKFTAAFDEVFRSEGIRAIRTPIRARRANAFTERWIGLVSPTPLVQLLNDESPLAQPTRARRESSRRSVSAADRAASSSTKRERSCHERGWTFG